MIVAVIIFSILVLQPIRVTLPQSTISKSTTADTTPTQFVAKLIALVPWTRINLMELAVLPIQCANMMWIVSRNILKMFSLKHFVEINIMSWFILVELVYTGKFRSNQGSTDHQFEPGFKNFFRPGLVWSHIFKNWLNSGLVGSSLVGSGPVSSSSIVFGPWIPWSDPRLS